MTPQDAPDDLTALREQIEAMRTQLAKVEAEAVAARQEAAETHQEVLALRDEVAAAERDQQDLRTARAQLGRQKMRALAAQHLIPGQRRVDVARLGPCRAVYNLPPQRFERHVASTSS